MQKRRLGNTDLELSLLGFGCGAFAGGYGDTTQDDATNAVKKAIKVGVNFFDTAPLYSSKYARSEEILGVALKGIPRSSYIVNTKCGRDSVDGVHVYDYSAAGVRRSFARSLKRLQLNHVDMLTLHDVEFAESVDQIVNDTLPELRKLQQEGKTRYIGISGYPLDVLLIVARRFKIDFILTYSQYAIQNERLVNYIDEFRSLGCGVINASTLVLGFFTKQGPRPFHYAPEEMKQLHPQIALICEKRGIDIASLATKYSAHAPLAKSGQITTTLVGIATPAQLDAALAGLEPLTPIELDTVNEIKLIFGPKWLNYCWRENRSREEEFKASVKYTPPLSKL